MLLSKSYLALEVLAHLYIANVASSPLKPANFLHLPRGNPHDNHGFAELEKNSVDLDRLAKRTPSPGLQDFLNNIKNKASSSSSSITLPKKEPLPKLSRFRVPSGDHLADEPVLVLVKTELRLPPAKESLMRNMHAKTMLLLKKGIETPPVFNRELSHWIQRHDSKTYTQKQKMAVWFDFMASYGVTKYEYGQMKFWGQGYYINEDVMWSVFKKIPSYQGICYRITTLSHHHVDMLLKASPGARTKIPGTYDISDLVINLNSYHPGIDGKPVLRKKQTNFVMATTPGMVYYRDNPEILPKQGEGGVMFVLNSNEGRFTTPLLTGQDEVDFITGQNGRMQLLGFVLDKEGNPAIFYFDNVKGPESIDPPKVGKPIKPGTGEAILNREAGIAPVASTSAVGGAASSSKSPAVKSSH